MPSPGADHRGDQVAPAGDDQADMIEAFVRCLGRGHAEVAAVTDLTRPWPTSTRTLLVTLHDGERLVVQRGQATRAGRALISRRIRLGHALRTAAPALGVPEVLGGDPRDARGPWLASRFVEGRPGQELLAGDEDARALGAAAGTVAADVARLSPRGLRLPARWADPRLLARTATGWLAAVDDRLGPRDSAAVRAVIARVPSVLASSPAAVQHGDLAPVNLVLRDGRVAGLLDHERVRLAPAAFDAAWFRYLVRFHHPERWAAAGPAFLDARGIPDTPESTALLDDLAALALLELAAGSATRAAGRRQWADRLAGHLRS